MTFDGCRHTEIQCSAEMVSGVTLLQASMCCPFRSGRMTPPTHSQQGKYFDLFFRNLCLSINYNFPLACLELLDAIYIGHMGDEPMTSVEHKRGSETRELMGHT